MDIFDQLGWWFSFGCVILTVPPQHPCRVGQKRLSPCILIQIIVHDKRIKVAGNVSAPKLHRAAWEGGQAKKLLERENRHCQKERIGTHVLLENRHCQKEDFLLENRHCQKGRITVPLLETVRNSCQRKREQAPTLRGEFYGVIESREKRITSDIGEDTSYTLIKTTLF